MELVPLDPGRMIERVLRVARRPDGVAAQRRVEMAVEDEVVAAAHSGQPRGDVEPLRGECVFARLEAVPGEPIIHVLAGRTFAARRAVDVAEREREINHLLAVDLLDHIIRGHVLFSLYYSISEVRLLSTHSDLVLRRRALLQRVTSSG